jgi:hypothetical protein
MSHSTPLAPRGWPPARRPFAAGLRREPPESGEQLGPRAAKVAPDGHGGCSRLQQLDDVGVVLDASGFELGVLLDTEAEQLARLAEAQLGRGDPRIALTTAEEARGIGQSRGQQLGELNAEIVRARALVRVGSPDAAAAALIERTGAGSRTRFLHLARAELAAARGDPAAREHALREAQRLFVAMGAPLRAERVARELGEQ